MLFDEINKLTPATYGTLSYNNNTVTVDKNGCIIYYEITYKGNISIKKNIPDSFYFKKHSQKIVILMFGPEDINTNLFTYTGDLIISKVKCRNLEGYEFELKIEKFGEMKIDKSKIVFAETETLKANEALSLNTKPPFIPEVPELSLLEREIQAADYKKNRPVKVKNIKYKSNSIEQMIKESNKDATL